jgi:hypothetical protein
VKEGGREETYRDLGRWAKDIIMRCDGWKRTGRSVGAFDSSPRSQREGGKEGRKKGR